MLPFRRAGIFSVIPALTCVFSSAACGGKVAFVDEGGGGSGGSGTQLSTTNISVVTSTTNTGLSVVTSGSNDSTGAGTSCDTGEQTSFDSWECLQCNGCAYSPRLGISGPCAPVGEACFNSHDCYEFRTCLGSCDTDGCRVECEQSFPDGVEIYRLMFECLVCDECPNNCDAANNCPF